MAVKNAAFLALIGITLLLILLVVGFVNTVVGVFRDVVPAMALLSSLVYLLACLGMVVFLFVFHRSQS